MSEFNAINNILVTSAEPIKHAYMYEFMAHTLEQNKIVLDTSTILFYSYLSKTKEYQVSYYSKKDIKEPLPFEYLNCKRDRIYIHTDFFAVTFNNTLYYYQQLTQKRNVEEIKEYVKRRLKLDIDDIHILHTITKEKRRSNNLTYLQKPSYKFTGLYASLYIGLLLLLSWGWVQNSEKNILQHIAMNKEEKLLQKLQQKIYFQPTVYKQTKVLMNRFEKNELQLIQYSFSNNQLHVQVSSHSKKKLYYFLSLYAKQTQQSHIEYEQQEQRYVLHTTITPS